MEGGDNIFLDVFDMADKFRVTYPDLFQTLTKVPATFQKVHYHRLERNAKLILIFTTAEIGNGLCEKVDWK